MLITVTVFIADINMFKCLISDRAYLRITEQEFTSLPLDVSIIE